MKASYCTLDADDTVGTPKTKGPKERISSKMTAHVKILPGATVLALVKAAKGSARSYSLVLYVLRCGGQPLIDLHGVKDLQVSDTCLYKPGKLLLCWAP